MLGWHLKLREKPGSLSPVAHCFEHVHLKDRELGCLDCILFLVFSNTLHQKIEHLADCAWIRVQEVIEPERLSVL